MKQASRLSSSHAWRAVAKGLRARLYLKLAGVLLLILLAAGISEFFLIRAYGSRFLRETDQILNRRLALNLSASLEPVLSGAFDPKAARDRIRQLTALNPHISIYLLDQNGIILASPLDDFTKPARVAIDLVPVREFIRTEGRSLILGEDPLDLFRAKPFSASSIRVGKNKGYLYVILESEEYEQVAALFFATYLVRGAAVALALITLVAAAAGVLGFFALTRRLAMAAGAMRRFERGDLEARAPAGGSDEISQIGLGFNRLADSVVSFLRDLQDQNRQRRELFSSLSHDLRAPLASLTGYLEILAGKTKKVEEEKQKQFLDVCRRTAEGLSTMVNELFERAKFDALDGALHEAPIAIGEMLTNLVQKFRPQAETKGLTLDFLCDVPSLSVRVDSSLLERAMSNFVDNAVKYTPHGGHVTLAGRRSAAWIELTVADTGGGIPAEHLPYIFQRFYRAGRGHSDGSGGTGLGLSISRRILEAHGGLVHVESSPGNGTTVRALLPLERLAK